MCDDSSNPLEKVPQILRVLSFACRDVKRAVVLANVNCAWRDTVENFGGRCIISLTHSAVSRSITRKRVLWTVSSVTHINSSSEIDKKKKEEEEKKKKRDDEHSPVQHGYLGEDDDDYNNDNKNIKKPNPITLWSCIRVASHFGVLWFVVSLVRLFHHLFLKNNNSNCSSSSINDLNLADLGGPLIAAAAQGHVEVLEFLLSSASSSGLDEEADGRHQHEQLLLLPGLHVSDTDMMGQDAFSAACRAQKVKAAVFLVERGCLLGRHHLISKKDFPLQLLEKDDDKMQVLRALMKRGWSPGDASDSVSGKTALHLCAHCGDADMLNMLLTAAETCDASAPSSSSTATTSTTSGVRALIEKCDAAGRTPLSYAIESGCSGSIACVRRLVAEHKKKIHRNSAADDDDNDDNRSTPLNIYTRRGMSSKSYSEYYERQKQLTKHHYRARNTTIEETPPCWSWTPLHDAVAFRKHDLVKLFLEEFPAATNARVVIQSNNNKGETTTEKNLETIVTPMSLAVSNRDWGMCNILVRGGCSWILPNDMDCSVDEDETAAADDTAKCRRLPAVVGTTPLHLACLKGDVQAVKEILASLEDIAAVPNKKTAAKTTEPTATATMVTRFINQRDERGRTALMSACASASFAPGSLEIVRLLLAVPGSACDLRLRDFERGSTALHILCDAPIKRHHRVSIAVALVSNHRDRLRLMCDPVEGDDDGVSAFELAKENDCGDGLFDYLESVV